MNLERKNLVVQLTLFIVFFIMGVNLLLGVFLLEKFPWFTYITFVLLAIGVIIGVIIYRKKDERFIVVTEKELQILKYLLYGYFLVYVAYMFLPSLLKGFDTTITIVSSIILMVIALAGIAIQLMILKVKKS